MLIANLATPNGAGNVILQQLTCICLIGWELNHDFYACLLKIFIPCATRLYYFPLQRSCPRKPVIGSLMLNDEPSISLALALNPFKKLTPVLTETVAKHVLPREIDLLMKWPSLLHDSNESCVSIISFQCIRFISTGSTTPEPSMKLSKDLHYFSF